MSRLRLAIFDVDGTLVDSQASIVGSMRHAFASQGLEAPARDEILAQVGLSLPVIFENLAPDASEETRQGLREGYKQGFMALRQDKGSAATAPLYPCALEALDQLHAVPEVLLGIGTGKSKRGLDRLLEGHGLTKRFVTQQVADFHPSKPHPAMIEAALAETGVAPADAVMIGDTQYDMEMAKAAGVYAIGVDWGYHEADRLTAADVVISEFSALQDVLAQVWRD